ncbi:peptidase C39 family protein [Nocardioides sp.]|uniref:peptidase C39 family protein n=1 Tax=Nocardioides sp. TaxID=35761 RepID=UPI002D0986C9|nr:peptidase C39 family protein [Nocardioides sp.]HXH79180.1 peptidase C39 family protein [Nocardioides sp.]
MSPRTARARASAGAAVIALLATPLTAVGPAAAADPPARRAASSIANASWSTGAQWRSGELQGLRVKAGSLVPKSPRPGRLGGRDYQVGTWTSPWSSPGFALTQLIPSWEAVTEGDSVVKVQVRGQAPDGTLSSWDSMAEWTLDNPALPRRSLGSQSDDLARVSVDTWQAATPLTQWQVRVSLYRNAATRPVVRLDRVGAMSSALVPRGAAPTSTPGPTVGTVLDVPTYSQMTHTGHSPQWGGGGEAWCSPTSIAMVLAYYGLQPGPFTDITTGHADPQVDHTARLVYDHSYDGTGNWAFNTAYASTLTAGDSYVTRLQDLRAAESFIAAGVPLVASVAFGRNQLTGAPITSSNGHLLVIVGFEADGDVVVNDPAGASNGAVRRVYDRDELEDLWLNATGGIVYVINR